MASKKLFCQSITFLQGKNYFEPFFDFCSFFFTSFFLGYVPSNMQSTPRCEPHPCISFMDTDEEVKLNCNVQGSPEERYMAELAEVKFASPFITPEQLFFFSKCTKKSRRPALRLSRIETKFSLSF